MIKTRRSVGGRLGDAAQWALIGMYLLGSFGILVLAVVNSGDVGALLDPGLDRLDDPKVSVPLGWDSAANPLVWIFGVARLTAILIVPVAAFGVILGGLSAAAARRAGDRRRLNFALLRIVVWVVLFAVAFSPYGEQLHIWLAD
ncbi:hypothetical protein GCM10010112_39660 [Actinoplanes lobatus]|uniref:Phosphatidylglycerophosphate synthase n=1 Tax=Actinoplanes lobatus TaxID=113568 RepID=A0A7W7HH26_9ACTN|nr:hypothetical protein [Actinoplanes lobatus]MBB4750418.1 phosphatidylglycerophosphate synthase [Actinoplanes lobatus]GGN71925.1 hypothetical protein GCM10010112_39660 [Actinoplanes lobatus]GIE45282.1 hypothetical protein Alo02nite_81800 [Actinoplanes lobatus]